MSEPLYDNSFVVSSCSSGEEMFDKHELMKQRHLFQEQELLEQVLNKRDMTRQDLLEQSAITQKRCIVANLLEDIKSRRINNINKKMAPRQDPIHPAVEKWFRAMDTKNEGRISSKELQQAFEIFQGKKFSDAACKFVVRIFDLDKNGGLDIKEFETLYYHIKLWINAFNTYDRDKSGFLDETELDYALRHLDIHFSPDFINFLITRNNSKARKISLDQYIVTCIQIQKFTDEFKSRDPNYTGNINIQYEDFLEMILRCL